uniref:Ion_trans domain-containing protein n=1 Tax=Macrostomum lignano TaxID=282301 RepID=A0A1I8JHH3_9PLAT
KINERTVYRIASLAFNPQKKDENKELKDAIFDVGFSFYTIIARLYDIDPAMGKKELRISDSQMKAFKFFKKNSMTIEIVKDSNLQKIHFRVRNKNVLREEVKEKLKWNVDRNSSSTKIRDFMDWTKAILNDIHYQKKVLSNPLTIALTRLWLIWNHSATLVAVIINLIMLIGLEAPPGGANTPSLDISADDTTGQWKADYPSLPDWLMAFAYILDALSIIILLAFFVANHPRPPDLARLAWRLRQLRQKDQEEENELRESGGQDKLSVRLFSIATFYYIVFVGCAFAGTFYSPYFFAFHLLNIVNNNQMLRGVIQAVTTNGLSLVWVSVLGIAIMYLYAVIGFAKFRIAFRPDDSLMFCGTLYQCFVTILRFGLIGDLFENLVPPSSHRNFDEYVWMALFSITFFVLISTIGLNIIFGIIVDTFSQLRDKKWMAETDMRNCCFICSRNNYDFEHHGQGFDHHVRTEHNMWAYIFFFIHLEDTATNDYTSLDLHVHKMLKEERFEFFPLNRALCLSAKDEDSTDSKIDELLSNVKDLVQHQKEEQKVLSSGHLLQDTAALAAASESGSGGVRIRGSHPAPDRRFLLSVPRPPHEEEDEDELPSQPRGAAAAVVEEATAEHLGFLDDYDEDGEPKSH